MTVPVPEKSQVGYAVFFPEGKGHFFCDLLGKGSDGRADLVYSLADHKTCVRKKTKPEMRLPSQAVPNEVRFYREHESIPRLISHYDHRVLMPWNDKYNELMSASIMSSFCNGGTFHTFCEAIYGQGSRPEEVLIWRFLEQMMDTWSHLHNCENPVAHKDAHGSNIFLHWPDENAQLPSFLVGDFGRSRELNSNIWVPQNAESTALRVARTMSWRPARRHRDDCRAVASDFYNIFHNLYTLMTGDWDIPRDFERSRSAYTVPPAAKVYSEELYQCLEQLGQLTTIGSGHGWLKYNSFQPLRQRVKAAAAQAAHQADGGKADYRRFKPGFGEEEKTPVMCPQVFPSRSRLLVQDFAGPYRIARVDLATRRILGVERLELCRQVPIQPTPNLPLTIADYIGHQTLANAAEAMEQSCTDGVDLIDRHASTDALTSVYDLFLLDQTWTSRLDGVVLDDIAVQLAEAPPSHEYEW